MGVNSSNNYGGLGAENMISMPLPKRQRDKKHWSWARGAGKGPPPKGEGPRESPSQKGGLSSTSIHNPIPIFFPPDKILQAYLSNSTKSKPYLYSFHPSNPHTLCIHLPFLLLFLSIFLILFVSTLKQS